MRIRIFVSFTQHTRNRHVLDWIYNHLKNGSIADYSSKHMSEYVITDSKYVERLLIALKPFMVNKSKQLEIALKILSLKDRYKNTDSFRKTIELTRQIRALNNYPKKTLLVAP